MEEEVFSILLVHLVKVGVDRIDSAQFSPIEGSPAAQQLGHQRHKFVVLDLVHDWLPDPLQGVRPNHLLHRSVVFSPNLEVTVLQEEVLLDVIGVRVLSEADTTVVFVIHFDDDPIGFR